MRDYPRGVMQNHAAPGNPPDLRPVGEQNWRMFSTLADAQTGLKMIQSVAPDAQMHDASDGQYSQFVYEDQEPDIRVRVAYGSAQQESQTLAIQEYPADIFDRYQKPKPFADQYREGQPHALKVRAATPVIGELYWA